MKKDAGDKTFVRITNKDIYKEIQELKEIVKGYPWVRRGMYFLYVIVMAIGMKIMFG